jgi:hypothetical protein
MATIRSLLTEENDFFKLEYKIKREHHSERTLGATMNKPDPDIKKIAKAMADVLSEHKKEVLHRTDLIEFLREEFGGKFVYTNEHGHPAIDEKLLEEFAKLSPTLVYSRSEECWRQRKERDGDNRGV